MTPDTQALIERARNHKMTPYETFEQRVSFVFSGQSAKTKDEIRQQIFEHHGCPHSDYERLSGERAAIVAFLRSIETIDPAHKATLNQCADAIEQGLHHRAQALADLAEGDAELIGDPKAG